MDESVHSILRGARLRTEQRAEDVAAAVGVTRQTLGRWETGAGGPNPQELRSWIVACKVTNEERDKLSALLMLPADAVEVTR